MSVFETAILQFFGGTIGAGIFIGLCICLLRKLTGNEHPL